MKLRNYLIVTVILILISMQSLVFADNKTGSFQEKVNNTHYWAYVPTDLAKKTNLPLVVALHGSGGSAQNFIKAWTKEADKNKFPVIAVKSVVNRGWSFAGIKNIIAAIDSFAKKCSINKSRVLMTGFSAGAHIAMYVAIEHPTRIAGVAPVGGGVVRQNEIKADKIKQASSIPVYFIIGEKDPNYPSVKIVKPMLEKNGFKVKITVVPNLGHRYPSGSSQNIWDWFSKSSIMPAYEKLKKEADVAFKNKKLKESIVKYQNLILEIAKAPSTISKDDKKKLEEYKKDAKGKLKKLMEILKKKEPKAFLLVEQATKALEKGKYLDAVKKLQKVEKNFPKSTSAEIAKEKVKIILESRSEIADKIAGSKPKTLLKSAMKLLEKKKRKDKDIAKAYEILREIVEKYPYTSFANKARKLLPKKKEPLNPSGKEF